MRLPLCLLLGVLLHAAPDQTQPPAKGAPKANPAQQQQSAMTGCLDQRGDTYVLRSSDTMARITTLKGKAFSDDNFARYIGQQVKVQGATADGVFEVSRIDKIADTCSK